MSKARKRVYSTVPVIHHTEYQQIQLNRELAFNPDNWADLDADQRKARREKIAAHTGRVSGVIHRGNTPVRKNRVEIDHTPRVEAYLAEARRSLDPARYIRREVPEFYRNMVMVAAAKAGA